MGKQKQRDTKEQTLLEEQMYEQEERERETKPCGDREGASSVTGTAAEARDMGIPASKSMIGLVGSVSHRAVTETKPLTRIPIHS